MKKSTKNSPESIKDPVVSLKKIGEETLRFSWTQKDPWLKALLEREFPGSPHPGNSANFNATLARQGKNYLLQGQIDLTLNPPCDRCGKEFSWAGHAGFDLTLIPPPLHPSLKGISKPSKKKAKSSENEEEWGSEEEIEGDDGVTFNLLKKEEVNFADYFLEQSILFLPMQFLCHPDCKGLCPSCGMELTLGPCDCKGEGVNPVWDALKGFKGKT